MDGRTDKQTDSIVRAMHTRRERKNLQLVKFVVEVCVSVNLT